MLRFEILLFGFSSAIWIAGFAIVGGLLPLGGILPLDLYRLYTLAVATGWLSGNVYLHRRRKLESSADADDGELSPPISRRALLFVYLVGPPSLVMLLWSLAPLAAQQAAPLVPIYAFAIFGLFFLVPMTLSGRAPQRP